MHASSDSSDGVNRDKEQEKLKEYKNVRVVDDNDFSLRQKELPECGPILISEYVTSDGYVDPSNPQAGRWISVSGPLKVAAVLDYVLWSNETWGSGHRKSANAKHLAWVPYKCRLRYFNTNDITQCAPIIYVGDSRARTQFYNIANLAGVPNFKATKSHENIHFSVPNIVTNAKKTDPNKNLTLDYIHIGVKDGFDVHSRMYMKSKDPVYAKIRTMINSLEKRGNMKTNIVYVDGLGEFAYGLAAAIPGILNATLSYVVDETEKISDTTVFVKTNESPWRYGGGNCNLGRAYSANMLFLKLLNLKRTHFYLIDTFQTTILREDEHSDPMHFFEGADFSGNSLSLLNSQIALNNLC